MKNSIWGLAIGMLCMSVSVSIAQENKVNWKDINRAFKVNAENPRKIFIDVYTDWCGWCKKMDENTFSNPVIASYLTQSFHAVKFNAEGVKDITYKGKVYRNKGQGRRNPHEFAIAILQGKLAYPSIVFMDEDNNLITHIAGYLTPEQLEPIMAYIESDAYKAQKWQDFRARFVSKLNTVAKP